MSQRLVALIALVLFTLLVGAAWLMGGNLGADTGPGRISFQIATGSTEGLYFPVGQAMAGVISHPPGMGRCETATVCGPAGLILSARTSEGSADNLRAVNAGQVDSGLSEGDVIAQAVKGDGAFRRKATHLRIIASLFTEQAHLVAADAAKITTVADLRGKRVMLGGADNTGAAARARLILQAYNVYPRILSQTANSPAQMMRDGKIDAYFAVAGVPIDSVRDLIARHIAHLVPLDGDGRDRLIKLIPQLSPAVIAANAYPGTPEIQTVSTRAYWVTRDSEPDPLVYGMTRSLFHPANRAALAASHPSAREIDLMHAADAPPAPLHSGAARYYREVGKLQ